MKTLLGMMILAVGGVGGVTYMLDDSRAADNTPALSWPLERGEEREKKLTFGLFVTPNPEENPIDPPERFTGYHSALDFEIFPEEESADVRVSASCNGKILQQEVINGYGGVIIQSCNVENQEVTVLYGHLDFDRFQKKLGDEIQTGEHIGFLGAEKTPETGNTRKHLHFGVHKGTEVEVRGYVQEESDLENFLNPLPLLEGN